MKNFIILSMMVVFALSFGCSRNDDNQDIQREEEMDQSDIAPEPSPSNMNRP